MLDFVFALERLLAKWPGPSHLTVTQISEYAGSSVATAVDALAISLNKELDVQDVVSLAEAKEALGQLQTRFQSQIAARERKMNMLRDQALRAYDATMERVRTLQAAKDLRAAYRTLSYFVGRHEQHVPAELLMSLYGDCLRLGSKTDANTQELGQWLRKGIEIALKQQTKDATLDAMDFVDAAGDYLLAQAKPQNGRLLAHALEQLSTHANQYELSVELSTLATQLKMPFVIGVVESPMIEAEQV